LTYDNAKLAHALIVSGRATGKKNVSGTRPYWRCAGWWAYRPRGHGRLRPIGSNGFYKRNGRRADFDQQPIEAQTRSRPAWKRTAPRLTRGGTTRRNAPSTGSSAGTISASNFTPATTGGCRDGLHADRGNENQGAESTLAFLLSLAEMRLVQNTVTGVQRAGRAAPIAQ